MKRLKKSLAFGSIMCLAAAVHGQDAYSSFGPNDTYDTHQAYALTGTGLSNPESVACEFTSATTGYLTNVKIALDTEQVTPNYGEVSLYTNSGGSLGTLLES